MDVNLDACDVLDAVSKVDADETMLEAIAALAHERAENLRLKREEDWLRHRIAEEDARLAHV